MTPTTNEQVGLVDMDGSTVDYDGQMQRDLALMRAPEESEPAVGPGDDDPPWIKARKDAIKRQPGWWRRLPKLERGMRVVDAMRRVGLRLMVLTKGPFNTTTAWTEKVDWCRENLPDAGVTVTEDKGLVYGRVLFDDWPPYILRWLEWRPRGLVVMLDHPWNRSFSHPNVLRYRGPEDDAELERRLLEAVSRD